MANEKQLYNQAVALYKGKKLAESEKVFREILTANPHHADSLHMMAVIGIDVQRYDVAEGLIHMAINENKDSADYYFTLGNLLLKKGKLQEALQSYQKSININPQHIDALLSIGRICRDQGATFRNNGMYEVAFHHFSMVSKIGPNEEAYSNMGYIYFQTGRYREAIGISKECIKHFPRFARAYDNVAVCYDFLGEFEEAYYYSQKAVDLNPNSANIYANMATTLKNLGRLEESIAALKKSLELEPNKPWVFSNLILTMLYAASVTPEELAKTSREFGERIANPLIRKRPFSNDRTPDRKLRIGYVSADFRNHAVNYFLSPIYLHDKENFELYAYSKVEVEDQVTAKLKNNFDHWRDIKHIGDDAAADLIEKDKIDILVDLAGHTANNGLMIFARKPAPIQVTWLGYTATTGMKAMDYRITDVYAEPAGLTEHLNTETLWRLPNIFCAYTPHDNSPDVIDHPPFEDNGYITFGCFNNFTKVTDPVIETWAKIMEQVPNSRLMLEIAGIQSDKIRKEIEDRLAKYGLPMERVILEPRRPENQYKLYNKIDIALDPFPTVGGTTSMDTIWMGVPFVTLAGGHFGSRMGVSILTNVGLSDLIAQNVDEYISIATSLALNLDKLHGIRSGLREKMTTSPLMDQKRFAQNMETAYREMWHKWLQTSQA